MRTILLVIFGALVASPVVAGDYELYVWSSNFAECAQKPAHTDCNVSSRHACSAAEVSADLVRYFAGAESKIDSMVASFGNGRVRFCSSEAKAKVSEALRGININKRGRILGDFIKVNKL